MSATLDLRTANGTAPIRSAYSSTVCPNLNADLLDGAHRDDILSDTSLREIQDAINYLLDAAGAADLKLVLPELEVADRSRFAPTSGFFGDSAVMVRPDRDPDITQANLASTFGGSSNADGTIVIPHKVLPVESAVPSGFQ